MERWAMVEIMGHRTHVGRIGEETFAGGVWLRIEALQRNGSFEVHRYGAGAVFGFRDVTEEEARRAVVSRLWAPCPSFRPSAVLPVACEQCGFSAEEHGNPRQLPVGRSPEPADDQEGGPVSERLFKRSLC